LLGLVQDLYAAHPDNRTFLHTRFGLGEDVLEPYKQTIDRWLWPDAFRKQDTSAAKAKQAISNYKKVVGEPAGGPKGAASMLGMKRSTLQAHMQRLGIRVFRTVD